MKKFDKFILWLFSLIILCVVVFGILLVFDLFGTRAILENAPKTYYQLMSTDKDIVILSIVVLVIFFILATKGLLFQSKKKKDKTDGILLENNNGKLLISRETLENLVRDISRKIQGTETVSSKIFLDENHEIVVNINAVVYQDAIIKEVTKRMQEDIKFAIKQASDLEVSEVNVNIERMSTKVSPEKKQEEEQKLIKEKKEIEKKETEEREQLKQEKQELKEEKEKIKEELKLEKQELKEEKEKAKEEKKEKEKEEKEKKKAKEIKVAKKEIKDKK